MALQNQQDLQFIVRPAEKKDCVEIRRFIQELADFENVSDGPRITVSTLEKDGFETDPPLFGCFIAEEVNKSDQESSKVIGHAMYYYAYSTWNGRKLFLEDLYVSEKYRRKNVGTLLFKEVAKKVVEGGCTYMDLNVLPCNQPAKAFYSALGLVNITEDEHLELNLLRLKGEALNNIIKPFDQVDSLLTVF